MVFKYNNLLSIFFIQVFHILLLISIEFAKEKSKIKETVDTAVEPGELAVMQD